MATVGAVYTVDPYVRTAEDVVAALFLDPDYKPVPRPEPAHKRVWASLPREGAAPQSSIEVVFDWLWWEFAQRNPQLKRPTVSLCDSLPDDRGLATGPLPFRQCSRRRAPDRRRHTPPGGNSWGRALRSRLDPRQCWR